MKRIYPVVWILMAALQGAPAAEFPLQSLAAAEVPAIQVPKPVPPGTVTPPGAAVAVYTTDEIFSFESQARPAMEARVAALKAAGVTTLGGRVVQSGGDYSFAIDYVPTVRSGAAMPPAVLIGAYSNGAAYWRPQDADAAMRSCAANFRNAKLPVLGAYLSGAGGDNFFSVDYLQRNLLRPAQEYEVQFGYYTGGKYTFESEAKRAVPEWLALFSQSGVPAIRGKAVQRADGNYAVKVEYVTRASGSGPRPQYAVARYDARETFSFEKDALAAAQAGLAAFSAAGAPPLSAVSRREGGDYSYSVDYLAGNIYQPGGVIPSVAIQAYQASETFTFEREARTALEAKKSEFAGAGMPVVGGAVTGAPAAFSYVLDYVTRAGQPGPHLPRR